MRKLIIFNLFFLIFNFSLLSESDNIFQGKKALANKKYKEAIKYFNQGIKQNPKNCESYYYLGQTYEKMKQTKEAIQNYEQTARMNCNSNIREQSFWKVFHYYKFNEDWVNLANISRDFLKYKYNREVEKTLNLAESKIRPEKLKINKLQEEAKNKEANKQYLEAAQIYEEIYKLDNNIDYLIKAGNLYKKTQNEKKFYETFSRIIKINPKHWYANFQLGIYFFNNGFAQEAIPYFETSLENSKHLDDKNKYFLNVAASYAYLNIENLKNLENSLSILKSIKYTDLHKEILENFLTLLKSKKIKLKDRDKLLQKYKNEESLFILSMIYSLWNHKGEELLNQFLKLDLKNDKFLRWSNFINQIYLILIFKNLNNEEILRQLIDLYNSPNLQNIMDKPYYNYLLTDYLENHKQSQNSLDTYFLNIIHQNLNNLILYKNELQNLTLQYAYFKIKNYNSFLDSYKKFQEKYEHSETYKNIYPFHEYISAIIYAEKNNEDNTYEHLKNAIQNDNKILEIAKNDPLIQELSNTNKNIKKLLTEN